MPTAPIPITQYGTPPNSNDPVNFDARADEKVAHDLVVVSQMNALGGNVFANALEAVAAAEAAGSSVDAAQSSALAAAAAALNAAAASGAPRWISGEDYEDGMVVWSPANGHVYRRVGDGSGVLDPSIDGAHWLSLSPIGDPTTLAITYDAQGRPQQLEETVGANLRQTTATYNADGTVATVVIAFGGVTRTETYSYVGGRLTGMVATEA